MQEIPSYQRLCKRKKIQLVEINIFLDPGANICFARPEHIAELILDVIY